MGQRIGDLASVGLHQDLFPSPFPILLLAARSWHSIGGPPRPAPHALARSTTPSAEQPLSLPPRHLLVLPRRPASLQARRREPTLSLRAPPAATAAAAAANGAHPASCSTRSDHARPGNERSGSNHQLLWMSPVNTAAAAANMRCFTALSAPAPHDARSSTGRRRQRQRRAAAAKDAAAAALALVCAAGQPEGGVAVAQVRADRMVMQQTSSADARLSAKACARRRQHSCSCAHVSTSDAAPPAARIPILRSAAVLQITLPASLLALLLHNTLWSGGVPAPVAAAEAAAAAGALVACGSEVWKILEGFRG